MVVPWEIPPLDQWSIVGMNHYFIGHQKFLFVAMVKDGKCIKEEGEDCKDLWCKLWAKAVDQSS